MTLSRFACLLLLLAPFSAFALSNPADMLPDPAQEARARALGYEIRCMVCQNQSIEDSEVGLARDLRLLVRERITAGDSDAEVKSFLHARYGDFVLLRPPFAWNTLILWATPLVALLAGFGLILLARRGSTAPPLAAPLSAEEQRRLAAIEAGIENRDGTKA
ncbi:cytochrome c-type biogenesis protein [Roseomonas sp. F4]